MFLFLFLVTPSIYGDTSDPYTDYTNFKINFGVGFRGPKIYLDEFISFMLVPYYFQGRKDSMEAMKEIQKLKWMLSKQEIYLSHHRYCLFCSATLLFYMHNISTYAIILTDSNCLYNIATMKGNPTDLCGIIRNVRNLSVNLCGIIRKSYGIVAI